MIQNGLEKTYIELTHKAFPHILQSIILFIRIYLMIESCKFHSIYKGKKYKE